MSNLWQAYGSNYNFNYSANGEHPYIIRFIRADIGFGILELYKLIENNNSLYNIRLKTYKMLYSKAIDITERMDLEYKDNIYDHKVIYGEIKYNG